jgi:hypothetical protein
MGKLTEAHTLQIVEYVQEYGKLQGCVEALHLPVCIMTLSRYKDPRSEYYNEAFANSLQEAKANYKIVHHKVEKDPVLHKLADRAILKMLDEGRVYDWVWAKLHPERSITEQAILLVISDMWETLLKIGWLKEKEATVAEFLSLWNKEKLHELAIAGKKLKYIKEDE